MPLYEYECESCGVHFEKIQSVQAEPIRQCPDCSGVVHKVFHPAGIIFKGSGWYITDSRKSTSSTVTGDSAKKETPESKPATTTPEAKPSAATTESKTETKT
ncbi:MAG: zinc ribbon domain-containing protein [Chloroflexi bacterium]|nr:zinc ribbon domain-containing protein [Chloroflexota bacterium]